MTKRAASSLCVTLSPLCVELPLDIVIEILLQRIEPRMETEEDLSRFLELLRINKEIGFQAGKKMFTLVEYIDQSLLSRMKASVFARFTEITNIKVPEEFHHMVDSLVKLKSLKYLNLSLNKDIDVHVVESLQCTQLTGLSIKQEFSATNLLDNFFGEDEEEKIQLAQCFPRLEYLKTDGCNISLLGLTSLKTLEIATYNIADRDDIMTLTNLVNLSLYKYQLNPTLDLCDCVVVLTNLQSLSLLGVNYNETKLGYMRDLIIPLNDKGCDLEPVRNFLSHCHVL